jgi:hypothetical protein
MDDGAAELHDPLERRRQVWHPEVREGHCVARTSASRVNAELGSTHVRLASCALPLGPGLQLDLEHALPEAECSVRIVCRELDQ